MSSITAILIGVGLMLTVAINIILWPRLVDKFQRFYWDRWRWTRDRPFPATTARQASAPVAGRSSTTVPAPAPPPGWYPDPLKSNRERYWDGSEWRDEVR
jgi:uncharacterized protein DUF2510